MKVFVMIPTYNERENIQDLIHDIFSITDPQTDSEKGLEIVVVDDNSPDGTAQLVKDMSMKDSRIHLILRKNEKGRGTAGIRGILYALEKGADYVVEMDSDYSHHPVYIPDMLREIQKYDVVIGSRRVHGGGESGRNIIRKLITWFANFYIRVVMGIHVKDCTSGYRAFRRGELQSLNLNTMISVGPSIVEEILYACHLRGYRIKEIPIIFEDRKKGKSTKDLRQYLDTMIKVMKFRLSMKKDVQ